MLAAAVRQALTRDSDGDGVPDILERPAPPRVAPAPPSQAATAWIIAGMICALAGAGMVAALALSSAPARPRPPPKVATPTPTMQATTAAPAPTAPAAAAPTAEPAKPVKPAVKLTNEQHGKNRVAAAGPELRSCVEQDLLRNPSVPTAYTVTVYVEKDGQPLNSATTFSPTPTRGFQRCGTTAIFYKFNTNPPKLEPFTFTTTFSFPDAKPAKKAEYGRGWD